MAPGRAGLRSGPAAGWLTRADGSVRAVRAGMLMISAAGLRWLSDEIVTFLMREQVG